MHIEGLLNQIKSLPESQTSGLRDLFSVIVKETKEGLVRLEERIYEKDFPRDF